MNTYRSTGKFFSLIELLVTISIIAVLGGLLLPVLNKARTKARTIDCVSRKKQFITAQMLYANDYSFIVQTTPFESSAGYVTFVNLLKTGREPYQLGYLTNDSIMLCTANPYSKTLSSLADSPFGMPHFDNESETAYFSSNGAGNCFVSIPGSAGLIRPEKCRAPAKLLVAADSTSMAPAGKVSGKGGNWAFYCLYAHTQNSVIHLAHDGLTTAACADGSARTMTGRQLYDDTSMRPRGVAEQNGLTRRLLNN